MTRKITQPEFGAVTPEPPQRERRPVVHTLLLWPNLEVLDPEEVLVVDDGRQRYHIQVQGAVLNGKVIQANIDGKKCLLSMTLEDEQMKVYDDSGGMVWKSDPIQAMYLTTVQDLAAESEPKRSEASKIGIKLREGLKKLLNFRSG